MGTCCGRLKSHHNSGPPKRRQKSKQGVERPVRNPAQTDRFEEFDGASDSQPSYRKDPCHTSEAVTTTSENRLMSDTQSEIETVSENAAISGKTGPEAAAEIDKPQVDASQKDRTETESSARPPKNSQEPGSHANPEVTSSAQPSQNDQKPKSGMNPEILVSSQDNELPKYTYMFWNVNGLTKTVVKQLEKILSDHQVDIAFLAGIHLDKINADKLLRTLKEFTVRGYVKGIYYTSNKQNPEEIDRVNNLVLFRTSTVVSPKVEAKEFAMNAYKNDRVLTLDHDDLFYIFLHRKASNMTGSCLEFAEWFDDVISNRENVLFFGSFELPGNDWDIFETRKNVVNPQIHQDMIKFLKQRGFTREWVREDTTAEGQTDVLFSRRQNDGGPQGVQPSGKALAQNFAGREHKAIFFNVEKKPWNLVTSPARKIYLNSPFSKSPTYFLEIENRGEKLVKIEVESSGEHLQFTEKHDVLKTDGVGAGESKILEILVGPFDLSRDKTDWIILKNCANTEQHHVKIAYNT